MAGNSPLVDTNSSAASLSTTKRLSWRAGIGARSAFSVSHWSGVRSQSNSMSMLPRTNHGSRFLPASYRGCMKIVRPKRDGILTRWIIRGNAPSHHFDDGNRLFANQIGVADDRFVFIRGMLAKIAEMIKACGLQIDFLRLDFGKRSLGKNIRGDVLDRRVG